MTFRYHSRTTLCLMAATLASVMTAPAIVGQSTAGSAAATPSTLVQSESFTYLGTFRFPDASGPPIDGNPDGHSFNGGGEGLAYYAPHDSIFVAGSRSIPVTTVAELAIPEVRQATTIAGYATATYLQPHTDILQGRQSQIGCGGPLGGLLPTATHLIATAYCYYDAAYIQTKSHFRTSLDFSAPDAIGPLEVQSPASDGGRAGFVSGYMAPIPEEWQTVFGGDALTGNCCIPIITRTSWGPAASVFKTTDVGTRDPIPATNVLSYPNDEPLDGDAGCDATSTLFNCNTSVVSVVFVPETASVLFFGSQGTGESCYGFGTADKSLHLKPAPPPDANPDVDHYCYDPAAGAKGGHAYPYHHYVWAYDANDLVRVKNGRMRPWQVRPYATWPFEVPFQGLRRDVRGVTYDPATRRLFVSTGTLNDADGYKPLMHVFRLD